MTDAADFDGIVAQLIAAGCVAAEEEALDLLDAAADRSADVNDLVRRRADGEPLAWITGHTTFCDLRIRVDPGLYVPRWQTEPMALLAADALSDDGVAIDLCTGTGAIAAVLKHRHPAAIVWATDINPSAVTCARLNGVDAFVGDLDATLPEREVEVITAVAPYVRTDALRLLPRDVVEYEKAMALDGGADGLEVVRPIIAIGQRRLAIGGAIFLEIGGDQFDATATALTAAGFDDIERVVDEDGDDRAITARRALGRL